MRALADRGIPAAVIGAALPGSGVTVRTAAGSRPLPAFPQDEITRLGAKQTAADAGHPAPLGGTEAS